MEIYIPKPFIICFVALAIYMLGVIVGCIEGRESVYNKLRVNNCTCIEQLKEGYKGSTLDAIVDLLPKKIK